MSCLPWLSPATALVTACNPGGAPGGPPQNAEAHPRLLLATGWGWLLSNVGADSALFQGNHLFQILTGEPQGEQSQEGLRKPESGMSRENRTAMPLGEGWEMGTPLKGKVQLQGTVKENEETWVNPIDIIIITIAMLPGHCLCEALCLVLYIPQSSPKPMQ